MASESVRPFRALLWTVWLGGALVTLWHAWRPDDLVVYSPVSAPVVETAVACAGILLAALFFGRWRQRGLILDLAACCALTVLATGKVVFSLVPLAESGPADLHVRAAALLCGIIASTLVAASVLAPARPIRLSRSVQSIAFVLVVVVIVGGISLVAAWRDNAFVGLHGTPSTDASSYSGLPSVTLLLVLSALAFAVASVGFARRQILSGDPFYGWLAVTLGLWALARLNYAWSTPDRVGELSAGDWLRFAGYGIGVIAASYEFTTYWRGLADGAVLEERRRLARDLHDGLAQELAFVVAQARRLRNRYEDAEVDMLVRAADRALDESRRGIAALTRPLDEPLDVALAQQAEEIGGRLGIRVLLDIEPVPHISADTREGLLRIAREAMSNAGRHGRPSRITVQLKNHDG
ncbi:MAG TPA: histidine kinase, partial [Gaiellales bacterium]|nr:histidine kinase [Gaiellales bacterium]